MDLIQRQKEYDALVLHFCGANLTQEYRQSADAWEIHRRIIRILNGQEPNPLESPSQNSQTEEK